MNSPTSRKENQLSVRGGLTGYHVTLLFRTPSRTGWKETFQTFCLFFFNFFYFTLCDFIYKMRLNSYLMRFWKPNMRCFCKILHWCPLLVKALFIDDKVVSSPSCFCASYLFIPFLLILLLLHLPVSPLPPVPPLYSSSSPSSSSSCSSACLCSALSPSPFHFLLHPFVSYPSLEFEKESL